MAEAQRRRAASRGGFVKKSIALTAARLEAVEEIAAERGGLSLSGTIEDLLKRGIEAYREDERASRRPAGVA